MVNVYPKLCVPGSPGYSLADIEDAKVRCSTIFLNSLYYAITLVTPSSRKSVSCETNLILPLKQFYFSTVVPSNISVLISCRPFVVNATFSTGLVGAEVTSVSWLLKMLYNNKRPTGKKHTNVEWDDGGKIGNKNKLILTNIRNTSDAT